MIDVYGLYSAVLLACGFVSFNLAFYIWWNYWSEKHVAPAKSLSLMMIGTSVWAFGSALALISNTPFFTYFWEQFKYTGIVLIPPTWLLLALEWTGRDKGLTTKKISLLYVIPFLTLILVFTNSFHHLIWEEIKYVVIWPYLATSVVHGAWWWFFAIYSYVLLVGGTFFIVLGLFSVKGIYRKQALVLLTGCFAPWIANVGFYLKVLPLPYVDLTPAAFIVTGFTFAWGISILKLIDIVPVARDAIFENMDDPVVVIDAENRIVDVNPVAQNILKRRDSEVIGRQAQEVFRNNYNLIRLLEDEKEPPSEIYINGNGKKHFFDVQISYLYDRHNRFTGRVVALRDITERKEAEELLKKSEKEIRKAHKELTVANKQLRLLNESLEERVKERTAEVEKLLRQKDEFISQLGHDLKNPLNPLINLLPIVEKREQDPKSKEMLQVINKNVEYMRDLVTKTIRLARLNAPGTKFSFENMNLLDVINHVIEKNRHLFDENKVDIRSRVDKKVSVRADKLGLEELFDNLITNAVKYSPNGCSIVIDAEEGKGFVTVSVKDKGVGLTEEQICHVFDEFYKADQSRHDLESSGLGLSICKRIVEMHGGCIWAESPGLGKGTTMFFTLPKASDGQNIDTPVRDRHEP